MAARIFTGCDLISSNFTKILIGGPYNCSVKTKPVTTTLTLASAVTEGDTTITVAAAPTFTIPKNVELTFGTGLTAVTVVTTAEMTTSDTSVAIEPAPDDIATATASTVKPLFEVYSASEATDTMSETELTDRVFSAGSWMTSKIVTRGAEISVNGFKVQNDPGLAVAEKVSKGLQRVYFQLINPDGETGHEGFGQIKGLSTTRQVDANMGISFTIGVDGEYYDYAAA